jgi:hypothetical protein
MIDFGGGLSVLTDNIVSRSVTEMKVLYGMMIAEFHRSDVAGCPQAQPAVRWNRPWCGWAYLVYQNEF